MKHTQHTVTEAQAPGALGCLLQWCPGSSEGLGFLLKGTSAVHGFMFQAWGPAVRHGCETQQMGRKKDEKSGAGMDPQVNKSENTKHGGQGALDVPIESKKQKYNRYFLLKQKK